MLKTESQIRAARGLLNWSQTELAKQTGLSKTTIANIEGEKTPITSIRIETLEKIQKTFEKNNIIFTEHGVEERKKVIEVFEGKDFYVDLLQSIHEVAQEKKIKELLIEGADDRKSSPEVINLMRKIRTEGVNTKFLVEEENTYLIGEPYEYRYLPSKYFQNYVTLIYGDKVAVCTNKNMQAIVFNDPDLAKSRRNIFHLLWSKLEQPEWSDADVRY